MSVQYKFMTDVHIYELKIFNIFFISLAIFSELAQMYTCPRTTGCKKSTCPYQGTTCRTQINTKGNICQDNDLMDAL